MKQPQRKKAVKAEEKPQPKRTFFVPGQRAVEAANLAEVGKELAKRKQRKDGDGNS